MSEKALGTDLNPDVCFGSRINFGRSRPVSICVGWLHSGKYLQGCIAEIVSELFKIFITTVRTFTKVFFFLDTVLLTVAILKVASLSL